ncbi:Fe-S cluster assembly protein HesB [archaeon SCG-AAA382B04]|nr:Fe-S cluster assembly protein HesB [archaeon SCG-AAA382B04]
MNDSDHKLEEIIARLNQQYGSPKGRKEDDTIHSLIKVILSQNTNDKNRDRAYRALLSEFKSPEELLEADKDKISEVISVAGLQNKKATRILESLKTIKQKRKELDLSFLEDLSLSKAREWLLDLPGVGPKSAAVVLNFDFDKNAFPVDTHVFRVTKRLGLIPKDATRKSAHEILETRTLGEEMEEFHLNLIKHGREICKAPTPLCRECFLNDLCDHFLNKVGSKK